VHDPDVSDNLDPIAVWQLQVNQRHMHTANASQHPVGLDHRSRLRLHDKIRLPDQNQGQGLAKYDMVIDKHQANDRGHGTTSNCESRLVTGRLIPPAGSD
jgi:hypothetical protein